MINGLPIVGWIVSFVVNASMAVPFWYCWTVCGIGQTYFAFLPPQYHVIGFWSCVGLFIVISILKAVLVPQSLRTTTQSQSERTP